MPLEILAFAWAPFVVVQPLLACGLLVLLAVAHRLLGEVPSREAMIGVGLIITGIGLIAWGAPGQQDTHRGAGAVIAVAGFGATVTGMTALQRARATIVIPISTAVQTFLPVALEPLFLRESFRSADLDGLPLPVGLVLMPAGIVVVARTPHVSAIAAGTETPGTGALPSAP